MKSGISGSSAAMGVFFGIHGIFGAAVSGDIWLGTGGVLSATVALKSSLSLADSFFASDFSRARQALVVAGCVTGVTATANLKDHLISNIAEAESKDVIFEKSSCDKVQIDSRGQSRFVLSDGRQAFVPA